MTDRHTNQNVLNYNNNSDGVSVVAVLDVDRVVVAGEVLGVEALERVVWHVTSVTERQQNYWIRGFIYRMRKYITPGN